MSSAPRLRARCKSALPENSGYCVGCGIDNGSFGEKLVKAHKDVEKSKAKVQGQLMMSKFFGFFRWR
jgi:hypothetical protein